jgi:hypothetical protein
LAKRVRLYTYIYKVICAPDALNEQKQEVENAAPLEWHSRGREFDPPWLHQTSQGYLLQRRFGAVFAFAPEASLFNFAKAPR